MSYVNKRSMVHTSLPMILCISAFLTITGITKSFLVPLSMRAGMLFKINVIQIEPPFWMTKSAHI
jgi:hypothetical protein